MNFKIIKRNISFIRIWLVLIFFYSSTLSFAHNTFFSKTPFNQQFDRRINNFEKVYIHFDKSNYTAGEDIWFKVYLVNAESNIPTTLSTIVHVDLINSFHEIIDTRIINMEIGAGAGEFKLPLDLEAGEFTVRAYTNFMRNFSNEFFYGKKIHVRSIIAHKSDSKNESLSSNILALDSLATNSEKPNMQFFPEGGFMVENITSRIGFKALGIDGKGIDVSGYIVDEKGIEIVQFKTSKFGMGIFRFTPKNEKFYKAKLIYNGTSYEYDLPVALKKGAVMLVAELESFYQVNLQSNLPEGVDNFNFIAHQNGEVISQAILKGIKSTGIINVPKSILKEGIVQFTIVDKTKKPLCERLVFVKTNQLNKSVKIDPSKKKYKKRELVEVYFSLDTILQKQEIINLSVAVTDASIVQPDLFQSNIVSHLLLSSELKGNIENPGYYFYSNDLETKQDLDLLMMTQGWRKYLWNEMDSVKNKIRPFVHENGINFTGTVKNSNNSKVAVNTTVSLTLRNRDEIEFIETETSDYGRFSFDNFQFTDSTSIIIQARAEGIKQKNNKNNSKNLNRDFFIELDTFFPPEVRVKKPSNSLVNNTFDTNYNKESRTVQFLDSVFAYQNEYVKLEEIELKARSRVEIKKKYNGRMMLYSEPSYRLDFDEVEMTGQYISDFLVGRVPGLTIHGNSISLRGSSSLFGYNEPLCLVDGVPVEDFEAINSIPVMNISFIDVIKGPRAAIYGSRAANGVIAVYTKRSSDLTQKNQTKTTSLGIINFIHPGYYKARQFYEPIYKTEQKKREKEDYRITLYWKPTLILNENGEAKISFYTSDASSSFRIELEGISSKGNLIKNETFFEVE